ncbi:hypothetical protein ABLG96_01690 [Nakamurella sp. A5-74]|uniref:Uncharacterized protein n=1 Tax=Nakamurella sp. A5-74 TaxID=3158264 RepID=A0AAU8DP62_9ACTN
MTARLQERLASDPDEGFDASMFEARRAKAMLEVPSSTAAPTDDLSAPESATGA